MTKEEERAELHRVIWKIANDLRGSVDGWDFKNYVLGMLFYRFISEDVTNYENGIMHELGEKDFDYAKLSDEDAENGRDGMVEEKGFFIKPSELFANVLKNAPKDDDLNITLKNVFNDIENSANGTKSEQDIKGLFSDFDTNSNKLGSTVAQRNDKLVKIMSSIKELKLGSNIDQTTNDTFGDAYEFLIRMYASSAGKSGGEFFTPQEVSRLLVLIALSGREHIKNGYDPACGPGSLLLQFKKILGKNCPNLMDRR